MDGEKLLNFVQWESDCKNMKTSKYWLVSQCVTGVALCGLSLMSLTTNAQSTGTHRVLVRQAANENSNGDTSVSPFEGDFQRIKTAVQKHFYDSHFNGVDWNKVTADYHRQVNTVTSRTEFATLMNRMLGELHASHTAYVTSNDAEYYMMNAVSEQDMQHFQVAHIGVMGEREGKEYAIHAVLDGGPADKAGLQAGDRLLQASGKPFASAGSFRGKEGTPVQVEFKREGEGKTRTISIVPVKQNMLRAYLDAMKASARIIEVGNKHIGYVHLWTMANDEFKDMLDSLMVNKLHDTDGLILDLRDGYGGHPFGYMDVFSRPDVAWETQYSNGRKIVQHTGYSRPMVALINEGTRSAKEFLAYQLKKSHRAKIVGTRTAGAFLGAGFIKIGEESLLELPEVGLKVNGERLEQKGVSADVIVQSQFPYSKRDAQLEQAQQIMIQMLPESPSNEKKPELIHVH